MRKRLLFALVPVGALLLLSEVLVRLFRAPLHFGSFRQLRLDQKKRGYPAMRHERLGYAPQPSTLNSDNEWGTTVTIDADGCRSNGPGPRPAGKPVVCVGDSFTFGDQVSDHETWPAYLEQELQRPVHNGGVFGYSLTQAVLRAEELVASKNADTLVVSFIDDDLRRCELGRRYVPLPWFEIQDGQLQLCNVPVQELPQLAAQTWRPWQDLLGHSALADAVLANTVRNWWVDAEKQIAVLPPGTGVKVGLLLVDRMAAFCHAQGCRLLFVLQGERSNDDGRAVIARARQGGIGALDLVAEFEAAVAADPDVRERWFDGHMTAAGNRWAAARIAAALRLP